MKYLDRYKMHYFPLESRMSKVKIREAGIPLDAPVPPLEKRHENRIIQIAEEIIQSRKNGRSVILTFGAHTIKNGMGKILSALIEEGWVTHLATNGAGVIHDWEFSYLGQSSEDVRENVQEGKFGTWEESGMYINLALVAGAYRGLGYGESIGALICEEGLHIPGEQALQEEIQCRETPLWKKAAAADFLELICAENLSQGMFSINHPFSDYSIQARSYRNGTPFTSHPMFGHDIIYTHRACRGAAIGRCAERDFLSFAHSVSQLEGGVYLSVGSAVMSPMIFEKSLSMARNIALKKGNDIKNCSIHVVDLQEESWDWSRGEPPMNNPAYYLRYMKTFNRMGCPVDYTSMDNRNFLLHLYKDLRELS